MRPGSVVLAVLAASAALGPAPARGETTGRILVSMQESERAHASVIARAGAVEAGPRVPQIGLVTVRPAPGVPLRAALRRLRADPRVRAAEPEGRFALRYEPDDPAWSALEPDAGAPEGTPLQWSLVRSGFGRAWDFARGDGALVAVIDTGIDAEHPDLAGKVEEALDFDELTSEPATVDTDGHGTHVGSIACAATGNGFGIAGAGFNCRLLVLKTDLSDASVARAIVAAADRSAHALNMSFGDDGGGPSPAIADAIDYAVARDVVLVAAAADEPVEEQGEPANLLQPTGTGQDPTAGLGLSVTAATIDDQRAIFAGRGTQISLAAYGALRAESGGGRGIFGLYPSNSTEREEPTLVPPSTGCGCRAAFEGDVRYAFLPGTSMAAPQVAATAAMMRVANPGLGALDVVRMLKESARRPSGAGWDSELGWGILDAGAALERARLVDRQAPASRASAPRRARRPLVTVRWRGSDTAPEGLVASGIDRYEVWRAAGARPARKVVTTRASKRRFRLRPGRSYAFWTIAVDRAGNREAAPARPDVRIRIASRRARTTS